MNDIQVFWSSDRKSAILRFTTTDDYSKTRSVTDVTIADDYLLTKLHKAIAEYLEERK